MVVLKTMFEPKRERLEPERLYVGLHDSARGYTFGKREK